MLFESQNDDQENQQQNIPMAQTKDKTHKPIAVSGFFNISLH